jgi:glycosyl transferase, family 25
MNDRAAVVVINLKHRTDRRRAMQRQLSRIGWNASFFQAIRPEAADDFPSIGARGCFLSHLSVLKEARNTGARRLVILEDDLNFSPAFAQHWAAAEAALERLEWSMFYPGHLIADLPPGLSRIAPSTTIQCAHFMVINGPAISTLITGFERILSRSAGHPLGGPMHVDGAYSTLRMQDHTLATYAYFPSLGYQRPSRTDIGHLKWFDRIGPLTPLMSFARALRPSRRER